MANETGMNTAKAKEELLRMLDIAETIILLKGDGLRNLYDG